MKTITCRKDTKTLSYTKGNLCAPLCLSALVAIIFSFSPFVSVFAQEDSTIKPVVFPANYSAQLNVVYAKVGDWDGRMDLYVATKEKKPTPIVINIHGE